MSKLWHQIFSSNKGTPPAAQRIESIGSSSAQDGKCYAIHFKSAAVSQIDRNAQYQLRICLYDATNTAFFGKPWKSRWMSTAHNRLDFSDTVFFHTPFTDSSIYLLVELAAKHENQNSTDQQELEDEFLVGWTVVRFPQQLTDLNRNEAQMATANLYGGTPTMLCFLSEPVDQNAKLLRSGGNIELSIQSHRLLQRAFDFVPENTFIGANEVVPGLEQPARGSPLYNPVPLAPNPAVLDQLMVHFGPHAEKIEQEMCELVNRERLFKDNQALKDSKDEEMVILERRVRIGVHNGWTYLHEPFIFHLSSDNSSNSHSLRRKGTNSKPVTNSDSKNGNIFMLRNRVELNDLISDPGLAIVIVLDFVVGLQTHRPNPPSQSMVVCWGAWSPFSQKPPRAGDSVNVPLLGGPTPNPDEVLCFKNLYRLLSGRQKDKQPTPTITAQFKFALKSELPEPVIPSDALEGSPVSSAPSSPVMQKAESLSTDQSTIRGPTPTKGPAPPPRAGRKPVDQVLKPHPLPAIPEQPAVAYRADTTVTPHWQPSLEPVMHYQMPIQQMPLMTPLAQIIELPLDGGATHAPILALQQQALGIGAIPRATFALLSQANFTPIKDRHGDTPDLIDPETSKGFIPDMKTELDDPLDSNEVILQFLAICSPKLDESLEGKLPGRVFFTFQFYRFPVVNTERLLVAANENEVPLMPRILKRLDAASNVVPSESGFMVKFTIDPQFLKSGEQRQFLHYLMLHSLHIDVWDADSLMLIGSCLLPLKYLCRCNREAVQSFAQLPVVTTELRSVDQKQKSLAPVLRALLYLKVANVGYPHSRLDGVSIPTISRNAAVISQSLQRVGQTPQWQRVRAKPLALQNTTLIDQFSSNKFQPEILELSEEKKRKIERLKNLRSMERSYSTGVIRDRSTKEQFSREIQNIKSLREESKSQVLLSALLRSLTVVHSVFPSLGSVEFMEFLLQNPFSEAITVSLEISDRELCVITDSRQWQFFKKLNDLQTPLEASMFLKTGKKDAKPTKGSSLEENADIQLFLKPRESIYVPFKYQTFHTIPEPNYENEDHEDSTGKSGHKSLLLEAKTVKVAFKRLDTSQLISIFLLQVEPQPHVVHQTFRFYHDQNSFLTKLIRVPANIRGKGIRKVHCTDPTVLCELRNSSSNTTNQDLFIKAGCGASPQVRSFHLMLYTDPYMSAPVHIWHISVHALQRIDVSTVQGHAHRFSLVLKPGPASQLVRVFSSTPDIKLNPSEPFLLQPGSVTEIQGCFVPNFIGERTLQINAVDVEMHELLSGWLLCASVRQPTITKAYQVTVPIGPSGMEKALNKKISFINQYSVPRTFQISVSREDVVQCRDAFISLAPKDTGTIALQFQPLPKAKIIEVLLFINDEHGNNEETYSLKLIYARA